MRLVVAGLGTVGSWLLDALERGEAGDVEIVARTSGRDGGETALAEADFDVLAEVVNSPAGGEPGLTFIRKAFARGIHVVTSDKWPVARCGVELSTAASGRGVAFRAESTVMSGTPVLAPLAEQLGGIPPVSIRGVVNATVNQMLTEMATGASYEHALENAQADGLAEPDPSADVDGRDECAKAMVLAALVFGVQLAPEDVRVRGVSALRSDEVDAMRSGGVVRSVTTLTRSASGSLSASVEPAVLGGEDPLRRVGGVENRLLVETQDGEELSFRGPGAGPEIAGLGVLNDLRAVLDAENR